MSKRRRSKRRGDVRKIYENLSMYLGLFHVIFSSFNKLQDQNHVKSTRKPKEKSS
jgi:hypothetical protein